MKKFILALFLVSLGGCDSIHPEKELTTSNPDLRVHRMGVVDGCTIYRFYDSANHYFVRCSDRVTTTTTHPCTDEDGSDCTKRETVDTTKTK